MSPPGIEPATLGFLVGHLVRLAIRTVDDRCFILLLYGASKVEKVPMFIKGEK